MYRSSLALITTISILSGGCATRVSTPPNLASTPAAPTASTLDDQVAQYVLAQEALAADDFRNASTSLANLVQIADPSVRPLAESAANAEDITSMRTAFKPLSEFLAALDLPNGYARAYCPMYDGGSNWVQTDGPVRNPYYGSEMLTCGVVDAAPGAHMDHTPRHGGRVFMAPDSFHHIEGAYPETGIFRLYATDNYREPVDVRLWMGRVVLSEEYDPETDEFEELLSFPLLPSPDGSYLEAEVGDLPIPADIIAKIQIVEDFPEDRFDFIFAEYSGELNVADTATAPVAPESLPLAERIRPTIPENTNTIVSNISERNDEIANLVSTGGFTEIFIPALQSKELALALNGRVDDLPIRTRTDVKIAVRSLVRAAWLLDWYGDLGNKQQVSDAYDIFNQAVLEIVAVYGNSETR